MSSPDNPFPVLSALRREAGKPYDTNLWAGVLGKLLAEIDSSACRRVAFPHDPIEESLASIRLPEKLPSDVDWPLPMWAEISAPLGDRGLCQIGILFDFAEDDTQPVEGWESHLIRARFVIALELEVARQMPLILPAHVWIDEHGYMFGGGLADYVRTANRMQPARASTDEELIVMNDRATRLSGLVVRGGDAPEQKPDYFHFPVYGAGVNTGYAGLRSLLACTLVEKSVPPGELYNSPYSPFSSEREFLRVICYGPHLAVHILGSVLQPGPLRIVEDSPTELHPSACAG